MARKPRGSKKNRIADRLLKQASRIPGVTIAGEGPSGPNIFESLPPLEVSCFFEETGVRSHLLPKAVEETEPGKE
jgi:hypothetical protein